MPIAWSKRAVSRYKAARGTPDGRRSTGLALMLAAMFIAPVMDMLAKILSDHVSGVQVSMTRFGLQAVFLAPIVVMTLGAGGLKARNMPVAILRGVLVSSAVGSFFMALKWMPLADAIAIFFVEPLILTVFSAMFLGEKVGWRRYVAVAIGLFGALLVIRPSFDEFGAPALLPLLTATLFATYLVLTSKLTRSEHPLTLQFVAGVSGLVYLAISLSAATVLEVPHLGLVWPTNMEWFVLLCIGVIGTFSHLMIVYAFQSAPASLLAPFHYLEIVAATILGYLVFGEFPDLLKWVGIFIIVVSGLYITWRERKA